MKISYRNCYPLQYLKPNIEEIIGLKADTTFFEIDENLNKVMDTIEKNAHKFKKSINYVTKPFVDSVVLAKDKLVDLLKDMESAGHEFCFSGTFITDKYVTFIDSNLKNKKYNCTCFVFLRAGAMVLFAEFNIEQNKMKFWLSDTILTHDKKKFTEFMIKEAILWQMFKSYAQVETKHLPANKLTKDINCKYVNDTMFNITQLDSLWFTNLVKSDAFKVRGHFRLQPKKKDNKWTKELIWINEFEKHGYTRKAGILATHQEATP
jgi:hypothetical protein